MTHSIRHHAERVLNTVRSRSDAGTSALAASWCRSVQHHGLDPEVQMIRTRVESTYLSHAQEEHAALLAVANPVLEQIFRSVGRSGCCVVLSESHGLILQRRVHDGDTAQFADVGLVEGGRWGEAEEGTNAIGTCLAESRPLIIHRDQHFASRNIGMSCMGAPVHDPKGRLVAALDVSSCRDDHGQGVADMIGALVRDAAGRIERGYFSRYFAGNRIIILPDHAATGTALLAADRDGLVVGASHAARLRLGLDDSTLLEAPALDQLLGAREPRSFEDGERSILRQALARAGGNASKAARLLGVGRATLYRRMNRAGLRT